MSRIIEFYFGKKLTPEMFLARGFLTGVVIATIIGAIIVLTGIN